MFKSSAFAKKEVFKRTKGSVLTELVAPNGINGATHCDFTLDEATKQIKFEVQNNGGSPYIITEEFGVCEESQINCFFVKDGVVIELIVGKLYLKDENGNITSIDDNGVVQKVTLGSKRICWFDYHEYLRHNLRVQVAYKFNIPENRVALIDEYINNLAFTIFIEGRAATEREGYYARMKTVNYFYDLGLEEFNFDVLETVENNDVYNPIYKSQSTVTDIQIDDEEKVTDDEEDDSDELEEQSPKGDGYKKAPKMFSDNLDTEEDTY